MRTLIVLALLLVLIQGAAATAYAGTILREGQSKEFFDTSTHKITVVSISDNTEQVIFKLGNELSNALREREKYRFADGSLIVVSQILINEGAEINGDDMVQFYFVGGKGEVFSDGEYDLSILNPEYTTIERPAVIGVEDTLAKVECLTNAHCNDGNACSQDVCSNKICVHTMMPGCPLIGECIPVGTKVSKDTMKYCDISGELIDVRADGSGCLENYQCTDKCINGACGSIPEIEEPKAEPVSEPIEPSEPGVFARIWQFLGYLFLQ